MKNIKLLVAAFIINALFLANTAKASFPTKQDAPKTVKTEQIKAVESELATINAEAIASEDALVVDAKSQFGGKALDEMVVLVLLWFFLGGLAAHRWYKGKPVGINILYIITLGGCGVWAIIDLINILTGKF